MSPTPEYYKIALNFLKLRSTSKTYSTFGLIDSAISEKYLVFTHTHTNLLPFFQKDLY